MNFRWLALPILAAIVAAISSPYLPGIYMDGVNPDYMVVRVLSSNPANIPVWVLPGNLFLDKYPLLVSIHHGALPFWLGLPMYALFGTDIAGIRTTHAAFSCLLIAAAWWMLRQMSVSAWIASLFLAAMAIDPAFHFIFRSAFYMLAVPAIFMFASLALMWRSKGPESRSWICPFFSGLAAGLSAYGYFIYIFYAFFVGLIALLVRIRFKVWVTGLIVGISPLLIGLLLFVNEVGDLDAASKSASALLTATNASATWLGQVDQVFSIWRLAFTGEGLEVMILGESGVSTLMFVRVLILLAVPTATLIYTEINGEKSNALRSLCLLAIGPPLVFGLAFTDRVWAHHFIGTIPLLYCAASVAADRITSLRYRGTYAVVVAAVSILLLVNAGNFQSFILSLERTGGVNYFSDATNRFAWKAQGDRAVYMLPDWGLFMPFVMITRGDVQVLTEFNPERARELLCSGRDVVAASTGNGAEARAATRSAAVKWETASSEIVPQLDGEPRIYVTRWQAGSRSGCPQ